MFQCHVGCLSVSRHQFMSEWNRRKRKSCEQTTGMQRCFHIAIQSELPGVHAAHWGGVWVISRQTCRDLFVKAQLASVPVRKPTMISAIWKVQKTVWASTNVPVLLTHFSDSRCLWTWQVRGYTKTDTSNTAVLPRCLVPFQLQYILGQWGP